MMKSKSEIEKDLKNWCVRSSGSGTFTTKLPGLSAAQNDQLFKLVDKEKSGKELTKLQSEKKTELVEKKNRPDELPEGAFTELQKEHDRIVYGIDSEVRTKQLEKGKEMEQDGLQLLQDVYNLQYGTNIFLQKNEERKKESFLSGEWDSIHEDTVVDIKIPWSMDTFRRSEWSDAYYWQLQTYMFLTGKTKALLAYCLVDAPEKLIYDEYKRQLFYQEIIDENSEAAQRVETQVRLNMTFSDRVPIQHRVKCVKIERSDEDIQILKRRAKMANEKLWEIYQFELKKENAKQIPIF